MSTEITPTIIVWAWTDRGDVANRVFDVADIAETVREVAARRSVGVVEVHIDDEVVAHGEDADDVLAQVEEHFAWADDDEPVEADPAPAIAA